MGRISKMFGGSIIIDMRGAVADEQSKVLSSGEKDEKD